MNRPWIDSRVAGQANVTVFGHDRQLRCTMRGYRLPDRLWVDAGSLTASPSRRQLPTCLVGLRRGSGTGPIN